MLSGDRAVCSTFGGVPSVYLGVWAAHLTGFPIRLKRENTVCMSECCAPELMIYNLIEPLCEYLMMSGFILILLLEADHFDLVTARY